MSSAPYHVSICIDSEVFARGISELLKEKQNEQAFPRIQVSLDRPEQVVNRLGTDIDLLILDRIHSGIIAPHLNKLRSGPRVVLVSEQRHPGIRRCELLHQTCGFFPARAQENQLEDLLQVVLNCSRSPGENQRCQRCPLAMSRLPEPLTLTGREQEIFAMIGNLKGNSEIAAQLSVSPKTVETHCANIKQKLGLSSSKELLKAAIDWVEGR